MRAFSFFLDWQLNCQFAGLIWAREKGLYRRHGLDVRLVPPGDHPGTSPIDLVLKEEDAAGSIEENLILRAALAGQPLRAVAAMLRETPLVLMTARRGPVKTLSDLPGRRVAMHRDGLHLLEALLDMAGVDPKNLEIAVDGWTLDDLTKGRFDAVQGYAITEARTLAKKGFDARLIPLSHPDLDPHSQVIFASTRSISQREEVLRAFLQASFEGWRQALSQPEEAAALVALHSQEHGDRIENRAILQSLGQYVVGKEAGRPLGALDPERWRRNLASYGRYGLVEPVTDVSRVIAPHIYSVNAGQ